MEFEILRNLFGSVVGVVVETIDFSPSTSVVVISVYRSQRKDQTDDNSEPISTILRELLKPEVAMIIIDEVSMLKAEFIVLLDERLRSTYDPKNTFGGKSISLVCFMSVFVDIR